MVSSTDAPCWARPVRVFVSRSTHSASACPLRYELAARSTALVPLTREKNPVTGAYICAFCASPPEYTRWKPNGVSTGTDSAIGVPPTTMGPRALLNSRKMARVLRVSVLSWSARRNCVYVVATMSPTNMSMTIDDRRRRVVFTRSPGRCGPC